MITKCPCSRQKGPREQLLILSKASKLVEEKVEPYGVVNKAVGGGCPGSIANSKTSL